MKCFRVFLGMGGSPLELVAYSSRPLAPFQLKQNITAPGTTNVDKLYRRALVGPVPDATVPVVDVQVAVGAAVEGVDSLAPPCT